MAGVLLVLVMSICAIRLDSGLRVAMWPRPNAGVVSVSTWIGAGSADEAPAQSGLAHFFEHMLFKGTARRGVGEIATELESVGGDINAWTTFDNIAVQLRVPPAELERGLDVAADMLVSPRFEASEIELEREVVLDELAQAAAAPQRALGRALFSTVFRRHPYRRPILGTEKTLDSITRADLVAFGDRFLTRNNLIVCIAGDFDPSEAQSLVERCFSPLRVGPLPAPRPALPQQRRPRERVLTAPVLEAQLILAFPSPPMASREHVLLDMISIALGQGASSVLARNLEGDDGLATSSGAYVHGFRDCGLFVATASADGDDAIACAEELAARVFGSTRELLDDDALETVRNAIISDSVYGRETVGGLAAAMGSSWANGGDPDEDADRIRWARDVSAEELRGLATQVLDPRRATLAAMLPDTLEPAATGTFSKMITRVAQAARSAPRTSTPKPSRARSTRRVKLPSGTVVVVHRDDTIPLVAAQATWRGGLRLETAKTSGIGALVAASIARGCGNKSDDELSAWLDRRAATLTGFSGRNSFGIQAEWIVGGKADALDVMLDCILEPQFDEVVIGRERRRLADEAGARKTSPSHLAHRMFTDALYGTHPQALDPNGDKAVFESMAENAAPAVRAHYETHYPASALTLAIVGDVDPDAVIDTIRRRLATVAAASPPVVAPPSAARPADRERFAYLEQGRAHLVVGFRGAALSDPDRVALEVLSAVLGGQGGRLFANLREKRGLVYRVAAHSVEGVEPGAFAVVTSCSPKHVGTALEIIRAEVARLRDDAVSEDELKRAVTFLAGARAHSLERRANLAAALAYAEAHGLGYASVFDSRTALEAVTPADLQRVAKRFLDWDQAVTSTVLPPAASPGVRKRARGVRRKLPAAARKRNR